MFVDKCINDLTVDADRCKSFIEKSLAMVTPFVPQIGYDRAAELAKKAYLSGKTIREVALAEEVLPPEQIKQLLG